MLRIPLTLVQDSPTRMQGASIELDPGKYATFRGGPLGRHRKMIVITNEDNNTPLYVVAGREQGVDPDQLTVKLMKIPVGQTLALETNAEIVLKNISGGVKINPVHVLEIFYE